MAKKAPARQLLKRTRIKEIGQLIKAARKAKGHSQNEMGKRLGHGSGQFVSNWERGQAHPPIKSWKKLVRLYGLNADDIIFAVGMCREVEMDIYMTELENSLGIK